LGGLKQAPGLVKAALDMVMSAAASPEVENAVFKCAERALYTPAGEDAPRKVLRGLFDEGEAGHKAREDYYAICARVVEVNVLPFLAPIFSGSKASVPMTPVAHALS